MPPLDPEAANWFATELQPHLPMLRAWVKSQFPAARAVSLRLTDWSPLMLESMWSR